MNTSTYSPFLLRRLPRFAARALVGLIALIASAGWAPVAHAATVGVPTSTQLSGSTPASIDVSIDVATGVEGADLEFTFDATIVAVSGGVTLGAMTSACTVASNSGTAGMLRVALACPAALSGGGVLFSIPFQGQSSGSSALNVTICSLNEDAIACTPGNGSIVVPMPTPIPTTTISPTATRSSTATATNTALPTNTATVTSTATVAKTATASGTVTATRTVTSTGTATATSTATATATLTFTPVSTHTATGTPTATPIPALAAVFVGQTVPAAMTAGQSYSVSVTLQNTGTATWTAASAYRLGAINPYDNTTWGTNRIALANTDSIATGQQKTFTWTVHAPATAGTYNFQWRMVQDGVAWFGGTTTNVVVTVAAPTGPNATFVSQSVPSSMTAGQQYSVSVTLRNSGGTTWTAANLYRLGSINPYNNSTWGMNRAVLASGDSIAPGQQKTFTWTVTAPATAGPYNFQWRMVQDGVTWFGDNTPNVAVTVAAPTGPGATFVSQSVPSSMTAGQQFSVSVTMKNSGATTWTAASLYRLGAINPYDNSTWGMNRVVLASGDSIAPSQQKTFTWTVRAPATAGTYNFQWRMVQDGVTWFGDTSPNVAVGVQ